MKILILLIASMTLSAATFRVEVTGKKGGPGMVLIPGLASSGEVWKETVARYGSTYECHVLTLAGFAGVPADRKEAGMLERVRVELAGYIREKKLVKPVIVGHSLGGFLALWLAAKEPGLTGELVIVDSLPYLAGVFGPGADGRAMRDMIVNQPRAEYEKFVRSGVSVRGMATGAADLERIKQWSLESDQWAVGTAMYELLSTDLQEEVGKIKARTLVVGTWIGMKDFTTREVVEGNFRRQYARLGGYRLAMAEAGRHFVMYDEPAWFFAQMDEFLGKKAG